MELRTLVVFSERPLILQFFKELARDFGFTVVHLSDWKAMTKVLQAPGLNDLFFWDPEAQVRDARRPDEVQIAPAFAGIPARVLELLPPARSFVVSTEPVYRYSDFASVAGSLRKVMRHTLTCPSAGAGRSVYNKLFSTLLEPEPKGFSLFFPEGEKIVEKISVTSPAQRGPTVEAVQSLLEKKGYTLGVAAKIAQAADELLMNAIFDAAVDTAGQPARQGLDPAARFEFPRDEHVELEVLYADDYIGLCASDYYGSLDAQKVFAHIDRDYTTADYTPSMQKAGAGLGLYGLVKTGFSLFVATQPGRRTDTMVFLPNSPSVKGTKNSFHFTSVLTLPPRR